MESRKFEFQAQNNVDAHALQITPQAFAFLLWQNS